MVDFGFLSDPNINLALSEVAAGLGGPGSVGATLGGASSNLMRRKQFQEARAEDVKRERSLMEAILGRIKADPTGQNLLGPKDDLGTADSITLTNDGINLKMPNPGQTKPTFAGEQAPLESKPQKQLQDMSGLDEERAERMGGIDLRDF